MFWQIYNFIFIVLFILFLPKSLFRMSKRGGYKKNILQRIGIFNKDLKKSNNKKVWIHGVSVGEIRIALAFINQIRDKNSEINFLISTTTSTAYKIAEKKKSKRDILIYFPIDLPIFIMKVISTFNVKKIILIESEFWPNLIRICSKKNIPISLINARISNKSFLNYKKFIFITKKILPKIRTICAQSLNDKKQLILLGARHESINIVGSLKFDLTQTFFDVSLDELFNIKSDYIRNKKIILLGASTWPGEEEILIKIFKELKQKFLNLVLIIAPRHAERSDEIENIIINHNFTPRRRFNQSKPYPILDNEILLLDSTGELLSIYKNVDITFIGKSLTNKGGQNPIEPAMNKSVVITGPSMDNFNNVISVFDEINSRLVVKNHVELKEVLIKLLSSSEYLDDFKKKSYEAYESGKGGLSKTLECINL